MKSIESRVLLLTLTGAIFFVSCTKNIEPMPGSVKLNTSFSLPVGVGEFTLDHTLYSLGIPVDVNEDINSWNNIGFVYIQDTIPLNLTEVYDNAEYIKYFMIRTNIWNDFPLGGKAQIYFLDENDNVIEELYSDLVSVPAAEHFNNGEVVGTKFESFRTEFDNNRIELLRNAQKIIVQAGLAVTPEGVNENNVIYFDQYTLKVQVAVRVDFAFNAD